jgi:hypothetical protein
MKAATKGIHTSERISNAIVVRRAAYFTRSVKATLRE